MKILVVEDDSRQQELARKQLAGHEVTITGYYTEAFKLIGEQKFDVLLTDMNLPPSPGSPLRGFKGEVQAGWAIAP